MSSFPNIYKSPAGYAEVAAAYDRVLNVWPVPYETRMVPTRFGETHVIASGAADAPPLVLLHGGMNCALMWISCVAELAPHFRIYAADIIGDPGKSVPRRDLGRPSDCAEWVADTVEGLGLSRASICGISWGGGIALAAGLFQPERVDRIVAMCPGWGLARPRMLGFLLFALPVMLFPDREKVRRLLQRLSANEAAFTSPVDDLLIDYLAAALKHYKPQPRKPWMFPDSELKGIRAPTLVLIGDREVIYNPDKVAAKAKRLIPDVSVEIVPGASHALFYDRPDIVNRRVIEFAGKGGK